MPPTLGRLVPCIAEKALHIFVGINERYSIVQTRWEHGYRLVYILIRRGPQGAVWTKHCLKEVLSEMRASRLGVLTMGWPTQPRPSARNCSAKIKKTFRGMMGFLWKKTQFDSLVGRYSDAQRFDTTSSERQNFDPLVGVKTAGLAARASKFTKSRSNFFP